jgi:hypothetical protein
MNDLAYTPPKPKKGDLTSPMDSTGEDGEPKPQYPSLRFNGHQAEKGKLTKCTFGEEYEMTIRVRATGIGGNQWERDSDDKPAVEFEVLSSSDPKEIEASEKEEEQDEEKEEKKPERKPKQRVVSPDKGFSEDWKD